MYQNGASKYKYELHGYYPHNTYIALVRDTDDAAQWSSYFSTAIDTTTNNVIFVDLNEAWQPNDNDDSVHILDKNGNDIDNTSMAKNSIKTRQSDNSYSISATLQHVAVDAPAAIDTYSYPLYIYELGEADNSCVLTSYKGNYALIYIP